MTVFGMADGFWWRGAYKGKHGLIPAEHVDVLAGSNLIPGFSSLSHGQGEGRESGFIDMAGCVVGK